MIYEDLQEKKEYPKKEDYTKLDNMAQEIYTKHKELGLI